MAVVVLNRNPSTPTSTNVVVDNSTYVPPPGVDPNPAGVAVRAVKNPDGSTTFHPVGALAVDKPQSFYGFLTGGGGTGLIVAAGRGSTIEPVVEGGVPLVPDEDVYLSTIPGQVTQVSSTTEDHAQLRVGVALDATRILIAPDFRINYF